MAEKTSNNTVALIGILSLCSWLTACSSSGTDANELPAIGSANTIPNASDNNNVLGALDPRPTGTETDTPSTEDDIKVDQALDPSNPPAAATCSADIKASTLYLINQARSQARSCGNQSFSATSALTWNDKLEAAALSHSTDMATHNFFSHAGSDGSSSSQRATNHGFNWTTVGENIAAGQANTKAAIQGWIDSPGHCANIMNPSFKEVAVACVEDQGAQFGIYWTNMLGTSF